MKDMTAQLSASVIDQSRQMGTAMDSHNLSKNARQLQDLELDEKKRVMPNEHSCAPASTVHAQSQTLTSSNALEAGFRLSGNNRSGGAPGKQTAIDNAHDYNQRWQQFCQFFLDTAANGGVNSCPSAGTPGTLPNGDIDVEGVLLQDTIDLSKPEQLMAVQTLVNNIVDPRVAEPLDDAVTKTPAGQETILKREHLKAIRNVIYDVLGSIISRRAAIPISTDGVGGKIKEIRDRASIEPARISANPSYNEIMLALTKERFYDPDYYARMANDVGAIKQEETSINAYTTLTLQDIYKLQEQVNALLAARAAIKFERERENPNVQESVPIH
jgi:hypothetical protein